MPENPATKRFTIPIGPQHPALKEPGHFQFTDSQAANNQLRFYRVRLN